MLRQAAEYVRMSRDQQRYSIENQQEFISNFAGNHGIHIARTYADAGKSGLSLRTRDGLKQLLSDVRIGITSFDLILVYDTSRWGRFQDPDEQPSTSGSAVRLVTMSSTVLSPSEAKADRWPRS